MAAPYASQEFANSVLIPCVLGWTLNIFLAGFALSSGFSYMTGELWASDTIRRKLLVVVCLLFCSAQAGQDLFLLVHWSATQNRSEADLTMPTVVSALHPLSIAFLSALVQSFLLERSIRLLRSRRAKLAAGAFFSVLIFCEFATSISAVVIALVGILGTAQATAADYRRYSIVVATFLSCGAVVDVGITALMCVALRKKIGGFATTDFKLRRLCRLSILSAAVTSIAAAGGAFGAVATLSGTSMLNISIALPFWYLLPSLYPLALLTALSSRKVFTATPPFPPSDDSRFKSPISPKSPNYRSPIFIDFNAAALSPGHPLSPSLETKHPLSPPPGERRKSHRFFFDQFPRRSSAMNHNVSPKLIQVNVQQQIEVESGRESYESDIEEENDDADGGVSVDYLPVQLQRPAASLAGKETTPVRLGRWTEARRDIETGMSFELEEGRMEKV